MEAVDSFVGILFALHFDRLCLRWVGGLFFPSMPFSALPRPLALAAHTGSSGAPGEGAAAPRGWRVRWGWGVGTWLTLSEGNERVGR